MATYRRPDGAVRSSITLKNTERMYCLLFVCSLNLNIAFACFDLKYFPGEKSRAFQMTRVPCHFTIKECKSSRWRLIFVMISANHLCFRVQYREGSIDWLGILESFHQGYRFPFTVKYDTDQVYRNQAPTGIFTFGPSLPSLPSLPGEPFRPFRPFTHLYDWRTYKTRSKWKLTCTGFFYFDHGELLGFNSSLVT